MTGKLLGGCTTTLEGIKDTEIWPGAEEWQDKIFFLENSENVIPLETFSDWLEDYIKRGIFQKIKEFLFGRPCGPFPGFNVDDYDKIILSILNKHGLSNLPVISQMNFGHTSPTMTLPLGVLAQIDCTNRTFSTIEAGCS